MMWSRPGRTAVSKRRLLQLTKVVCCLQTLTSRISVEADLILHRCQLQVQAWVNFAAGTLQSQAGIRMSLA